MKDVLEDVPGQMKNAGIVAMELPMKVLCYEPGPDTKACDTTSATVWCVQNICRIMMTSVTTMFWNILILLVLLLNTAFDIVSCCCRLPFSILTSQCLLSSPYGYYCCFQVRVLLSLVFLLLRPLFWWCLYHHDHNQHLGYPTVEIFNPNRSPGATSGPRDFCGGFFHRRWAPS